jgi:acetylornithine deacetylase/succinyl-diaminopimelate desuccinylase-like protein
VNATIHQINERIETQDLDTLTRIYQGFIERYFAAFGNEA